MTLPPLLLVLVLANGQAVVRHVGSEKACVARGDAAVMAHQAVRFQCFRVER